MEVENATQDRLTIDCAPGGRNGFATLTAKINGEVIALQKLDVTNPKHRTDFAKRLCEGRKGIDAAAMEAELLRLAEELTNKLDKPQADTDAAEIDVSRLVRPERFILPEVSGLAVPTMTVLGDRPDGAITSLYLKWANGQREGGRCARLLTCLRRERHGSTLSRTEPGRTYNPAGRRRRGRPG